MRGWHVVLALALITAAACTGRGDVEGEADGEAGGTLQVAGEEANDHGTVDVTGRAEVEMELDDFYFEPTVLSGQAGQTLTVKMFNEGDQAHTFTIGSIGVDVEVPPGVRPRQRSPSPRPAPSCTCAGSTPPRGCGEGCRLGAT